MPARVLVVDDSVTFRSLFRRILDDDPGLRVIGEAADGREAIDLVGKLAPDVITMDVEMPRMNGLEAIRQIMETDPRPIVVVSGSLDPRDVKQAFRAIEAGALAVVAKPPSANEPNYGEVVHEITTTVRLMAEVKVIKRRRRESGVVTPRIASPSKQERPEIVAIAASTGGPAALATILRELPTDLPIPIAIVQHIAAGFARGLVDWLQSISKLEVQLASDGVQLEPGRVVVSDADRHFVVNRRTVRLDTGPLVDGHRPSASRFFSSVASSWGSKGLGVVLTGMGKDGTRGLIDLKQARGCVIAQDAATSVVDGMPRAARAAGIVDHVLPLEAIAPAIVKMCGGTLSEGVVLRKE